MNKLRKISSESKFVCIYCKNNYPDERELTVHMFIHGNYDLNAYLCRSRLFVRSNSLPRAYPNSPSVSRNKLYENSKIYDSKIMSKNQYAHRINEKPENFLTKLPNATLDKRRSLSPYLDTRSCRMPPKNLISLSPRKELIQLIQKCPVKSASFWNSERTSGINIELLQQNSEERRMSSDSSDSGVFEESDSSPEKNESKTCISESYPRSENTSRANFRIAEPEKNTIRVNNQKLINFPDFSKPGPIENNLNHSYNSSLQNFTKSELISGHAIGTMQSTRSYQGLNGYNIENSKLKFAKTFFPQIQGGIST